MTEATTAQAVKPPRITAVVFGVFAAVLTWQGIGLLALGGSPYYLVAGVAILVAAWDLFAGRPRGFVIFSGVLLMTLAWAVYESGTGFWTVATSVFSTQTTGLAMFRLGSATIIRWEACMSR